MAIEALRLSKHRGITSLVLTDLGRINVVCGKNNSGKSSILQAITQPASCEVAVRVDEQLLTNLIQSLGTFVDTAFDHPKGAMGVMSDLINLEFSQDSLWFREDANLLMSRFLQARESSPFNRRNFNADGITKVFQAVTDAEVRAMLIPAKRRLQETDSIGREPTPTPDGAGALGRLFYMRNRIPTHADFERQRLIQDKFSAITRGFEFGVFADVDHLMLRFRIPGRDWVDANECGLGLQDLVVLLFHALTADEEVLCIEEPENHLHPEMQKALLRVLRTDTQKQYMLATHSNVFLNAALVDRVFLATSDNGSICATDSTSRADMLSELGYDVADNLVSDVVVLVEGPTDVPIIEELLLKRGTLMSFSVKMWPLGGDMMQHVDLSVLAEHKKVIALIDSDPGSKVVRERFKKKCSEASIPVVQLDRYSIENYFTMAALRSVFKGQVPASITDISPQKPVDEQLGIEVKNNNRRLARAMVLGDLAGTDLMDFVQHVDEMCRT
jgi:hypothetical protein